LVVTVMHPDTPIALLLPHAVELYINCLDAILKLPCKWEFALVIQLLNAILELCSQ
jgi:hypothetical protein